MRKVLVGAAVVMCAAVSSFASWDYFPPKDAGSGEAKLGFEFGIPAEKVTTMDLMVGARYSIIDGLEASVKLPVPLSMSFDGNSAEKYAGLSCPVIGVRYWLPMGLGFFLDAVLPVDTREGLEPHMTLGVGAQYSMDFTEELSFGSEVGMIIPFPKDDITPSMELKIGLEFNYSIGAITPILGAEVLLGLTKSKMKMDLGPFGGGEIEIEADAPPMDIGLLLGVAYDINEMFGADVTFGMRFGDRHGDSTPLTIGASFAINF